GHRPASPSYARRARAGMCWSSAAGRTEIVETRAVLVATPAYVSAELVADLDATAATALKTIAYAPVAVANLAYNRAQVAHPLEGFGVLAPSQAQRNFLGILWASSLFPSAAPKGKVLTITLMGGALRPELALRDEQAIIASAIADHEALLGARGTPELAHATRWERAIPQYTFDHEQRIAAVEKLERSHPGLYLLGSYRGGVGVPKCWLNAVATAESAASYLGQTQVRSEPVL
ncbi:MAG: protoporphyrinogen oxidase, partial [Oscillochloris sp.]|nr:protoporphyrinogen oxidase [Oscillochloris sp.]